MVKCSLGAPIRRENVGRGAKVMIKFTLHRGYSPQMRATMLFLQLSAVTTFLGSLLSLVKFSRLEIILKGSLELELTKTVLTLQ